MQLAMGPVGKDGGEKVRGALVIEDHVGDAADFLVSGNGDNRNRKWVLKQGIDGDEPFGAATDEQARIFFNEVGLWRWWALK